MTVEIRGGIGSGADPTPPSAASRYDVVVVGARVAGAATALFLQRCGHRVLLLDRVKMPADTVSTHAVLRSGVMQLQRLGVWERVVEAGTPPVRDVMLGFGGERIRVEIASEFGVDSLYAPRRYVLDQILFEAAVEEGVEAGDGTSVSGLLRQGGRVTGVTVAGGVEIEARMVIGADGFNSKVAQLAEAQTYERHSPANAVHYAYYTGIDFAGFWFQFTPGTTAGLIQTNGGEVLAFVGRRTARMPAFRQDPEGEFGSLLAEAAPELSAMVGGAERVSPFRGTTGLPGFIRKPWGRGWALVGDAGYTKDPISAHGISDALRDAELCARAVDQVLRSPSRAREALSRYQAIRDGLSWRMYWESQMLAAYRWGPAEASTRMRAISQAVRDECELLASLPPWAGVDGQRHQRPVPAVAS